MGRHRSVRHGGNRGVAAVEMALAVPVLVLMLVAGVDFARVFYYGMVLDGCARNGALYAQLTSVDPVSRYANVQAAVLADASVNGLTPAPTIAVGYASTASGPFTAAATPPSTGYVQVVATWTFSTLVQYVGIPYQTTLSRACVMALPPTTPSYN